MSSSSRVSRVMLSAAKSISTIKRSTPTTAAASRCLSTKSSSPLEDSESPTKKGSGSFNKPLLVSPLLGGLLGVSQASRSEVTKKIWDYIKLNNLQNPSNKRMILCDEKLKRIFDGKEQVGMLEIGKLLNPHFIKT